jgi:hypothetical protein
MASQLLTAVTGEDLTQMLQQGLLRISGAAQVGVYLCNNTHSHLELHAGEGEASIPLGADDHARQGYVREAWEDAGLAVRSEGRLALALLSEGQPSGVAAWSGNVPQQAALLRQRPLHPQIAQALMHLGEISGLRVRMLQHQHTQEQLWRSERVSSSSQMLRGLLSELSGPIESLNAISAALLGAPVASGAPLDGLRLLAQQSRRVTETLHRLAVLARSDRNESLVLDLHVVLEELIRQLPVSKRPGHETPRIHAGNATLRVQAPRVQLEFLLQLLLHGLEDHHPPHLIVTRRAAKSAVVEFRFHHSQDAQMEGMMMARSLAQNLGGDLRQSADNTLILELPEAVSSIRPSRLSGQNPGPQLTILLLDEDATVQRRCLDAAAEEGHRLVAFRTSAEALEAMRAIAFDVCIASAHQSQGYWTEFYDRASGRCPFFVLLANSLTEEETALWQGRSGYLLPHPPVTEALRELLRVLAPRTNETLAPSEASGDKK